MMKNPLSNRAAMKSWSEIRKDATKFAHRWKGAYDEKFQAQAARGPVGFICVECLFRSH